MSLGPQIERNVTLKAAANRMNSGRGSGSESSTLNRATGQSPNAGTFFASRNAGSGGANTLGHMASKQFMTGDKMGSPGPGQNNMYAVGVPQNNFM